MAAAKKVAKKAAKKTVKKAAKKAVKKVAKKAAVKKTVNQPTINPTRKLTSAVIATAALDRLGRPGDRLASAMTAATATVRTNDVTERERIWQRFTGDDWTCFDALPPALRQRLRTAVEKFATVAAG